MQIFFKSIFVVSTLLVMQQGVLAEPAGAGEVPAIGFITDLSGPVAYWGRQTRLGAEIAAAELATEGRPVKLFFEDHQLNTTKAVTAAQKLINLDRVDVLYSEFTPTTIAASSVAKNMDVLMVYAAAAASPALNSQYAFKSYLNYVDGCEQLSRYWHSKGIRKVGVLKATSEFGDLCNTGVRKVFPGALELDYAFGDEVRTQVLMLKAKGVEAVMNATFGPDMQRMLKSMRAINYLPRIGTNEDAVSGDVQSAFPDALDHITLFGFTRIPESFVAKVKSREPENELVSLEAAALAYVHVKQLEDLIRKCGGTNVSCQQEALSQAGPDETIGFTGWEDRIASFQVALKSWKNGKSIVLQ